MSFKTKASTGVPTTCRESLTARFAAPLSLIGHKECDPMLRDPLAREHSQGVHQDEACLGEKQHAILLP